MLWTFIQDGAVTCAEELCWEMNVTSLVLSHSELQAQSITVENEEQTAFKQKLKLKPCQLWPCYLVCLPVGFVTFQEMFLWGSGITRKQTSVGSLWHFAWKRRCWNRTKRGKNKAIYPLCNWEFDMLAFTWYYCLLHSVGHRFLSDLQSMKPLG